MHESDGQLCHILCLSFVKLLSDLLACHRVSSGHTVSNITRYCWATSSWSSLGNHI